MFVCVVCIVQGEGATCQQDRCSGLGVGRSIPVAGTTSLGLIAAAVVVISSEIIVKVTIAHVRRIVGGLLATREGSEGVAVKVGFVCHESIIRGQQWGMGQIETTSPGVTFNHLIGAPLVMRQTVMGSSVARAIR